MRLIDYFDRGWRLHRERACIIGPDRTYTYDQAAELSRRIANGMAANGITKASTFAALSPNCATVYAACLGGVRAGAKWTSLAAGNAFEESIQRLKHNDCEWLFFHSSFESRIPGILSEVPTLRGLVCVDGPSAHAPDLDSWASAHSPQFETPPIQDDEVVFHVGSGGSSGLPKSVELTQGTMRTLYATMLANFHHDEPPVQLIPTSVTYAQGAVAFWLMAQGATNVLLTKADPLAVMEAIERYRVTIMTLPPTLIYRLLKHERVRDFDYSSLHYIHYAMAPMAVDKLREAIEVFGDVMIQTYGQAEAPTIVSCLSPHDHRMALEQPELAGRLKSCGRPSVFADAAIMDDAGQLLPADQIGEIVCRGPLLMKGYYKDPEATAVLRQNGWQRTGDLGHLDADGYLYIDGRKKEMIITGGYNVYPAAVEKVLGSHSAVRDCVVLGAPDADWGEIVVGVVDLLSVEPDTEASILAYCRERLGPIKTPKRLIVRGNFPRNEVGKVLRHELRRELLGP